MNAHTEYQVIRGADGKPALSSSPTISFVA